MKTSKIPESVRIAGGNAGTVWGLFLAAVSIFMALSYWWGDSGFSAWVWSMLAAACLGFAYRSGQAALVRDRLEFALAKATGR